MRSPPNKVEHLYVHVPFCAAKCNYCAFYSESGSAAKMSDYVDAAVKELEGHAPSWPTDESSRDGARPSNALNLQPTTIFFGGGTPSLLPTPLMRRILEAVGRVLQQSETGVSPVQSDPNGQARRLSHYSVSEFTVECNPSTVSTEKANLFREFGVNRISMGVQSLDDDLLETLGRVHSVKAAIASYEKLRVAGFDNINLDLMFGLPGQTLEHWRNTLERAIALQPEHISTYCLILEEDTEFWRLYSRTGVSPVSSDNTNNDDGQAGRLSHFPLPNDDEQLAMYELGIETLTAAGYRQYEISNFAKPDRECRHNIAYWEGEDYLGLGPSACSTIGNRRWQTVPDIEKYVQAMGDGRWAMAYEETLTPELRVAERAAFGMRMNAGVPADLVRGRWDKQIAELLSAELVQWRQGRLTPTKRGLLFADEVAAEFV